MLSGMGSGAVDVFRMARSRWEKKQAKILNQVRTRMMKRKSTDETSSYWDNLWGKDNQYQKSEEKVQERAQRAAAAARRWREYSLYLSNSLTRPPGETTETTSTHEF